MKYEVKEKRGKYLLTNLDTEGEDKIVLPEIYEAADAKIVGIASEAILGEEMSMLIIPDNYYIFEDMAVVDCPYLTEVHLYRNKRTEDLNLDNVFIKYGNLLFEIYGDDTDIRSSKYMINKHFDIFSEEGVSYVGNAKEISITAIPDTLKSIYIPDKYIGKDVSIAKNCSKTENVERIRFPKTIANDFYNSNYNSLKEAIFSPFAEKILIPRAGNLKKVLIGKETKKIDSLDDYENLEEMNIDFEDIKIDFKNYKNSPWFENFEKSSMYKKMTKKKEIEIPENPEDLSIDDINFMFIKAADEISKSSKSLKVKGKPSVEEKQLVDMLEFARKLAIFEKISELPEDERDEAFEKIYNKKIKDILDEFNIKDIEL